MNDRERHQFLIEWNDTKREYLQDKCVHQLFEEQVERTPDAVALVFQDQQLTYGELNIRGNQLAHYLRKLGVGPDALVAICVERSVEMIVGLLGILKAGGAYVPLDPSYPREQLAFMLEDTQVPVLLTQQSLSRDLPQHGALVVCLDAERDRVSPIKQGESCHLCHTRQPCVRDLYFRIHGQTKGRDGVSPWGLQLLALETRLLSTDGSRSITTKSFFEF